MHKCDQTKFPVDLDILAEEILSGKSHFSTMGAKKDWFHLEAPYISSIKNTIDLEFNDLKLVEVQPRCTNSIYQVGTSIYLKIGRSQSNFERRFSKFGKIHLEFGRSYSKNFSKSYSIISFKFATIH